MILRVKLKPTRMSAPTKAALVAEITARWGCFFSSGSSAVRTYSAYRAGRSGDFVLFNLVKYRRKTAVTCTGTSRNARKKGRVLTSTRQVVREAHWDAYIYIVPERLVQVAKQHNRNFTLEA